MSRCSKCLMVTTAVVAVLVTVSAVAAGDTGSPDPLAVTQMVAEQAAPGPGEVFPPDPDGKLKGPVACHTMLSPNAFFPWDGAQSYASDLGFRYSKDTHVGSLIASVPASVLPDGSTLREVCYSYRDQSLAGDFAAGLARSYIEGHRYRALILRDLNFTSDGAEGYGFSCKTTNVEIDRRRDWDGNTFLELSDYVVIAGYNVHEPVVTDGSVAVGQVWFGWDPPPGWDGCH